MQSPHTSGVRRSLQFALVLASSLSLASVCYAAQAKAPRTTLDKIQSARDAGDISQHQADQLVLDALFHPDRLEDKYLFDGQELLRANGRPLPGRTAGPIKARCGVPALKPILERYRTLARDVQVQVDELLRTRQSYVAELKFPSPGGHFLVHYSVNAADAPNNVDPTDTSTHGQGAGVFNSFNAPDYVEDVAAYFDASWTAFVGTGAVKFNAPPVDGTEGGGANLLDVYVAEIGAYGITTLSWTVWVHVDRNMPRPMRKVTAAHEFFHCVQGSYDWFEPLWMIEGTAMYAEDVVYDDVNDYIGYSLNDHLYFPSLSLTEDANGGYSSVLYWKFFGEHYGTDGSGNAAYLEYASPNKIGYDDSGVDAIKKVMDALVDYEGTEGIDAVLAPVSKSFELSFCDWLKNNYLKDLGNPFAEGYLDYLEDENGYASITSSGLSRSWTVPSSGVLAPQTWNGLMSPWAGEFFRLSLSAMTGQINISLNGANDTASATNRFARLMVLCLGDANSDGYPDSMPQSFEYPLSAANDATASIPNAGYQQVIVIVAAADNGGDYALTVSTTAGAGTCTLTVQSTPVTGVAITGDKAGTTNYTASCTLNSTVSLSAPASLTSGGVPYTFTRWTIDGTPRTDGLNPVQVQMNANHTAVAVYTKVTYTLSVQSTPAGATITGDKPGTTNYAATCDALSTVSLTAAPSLTSGGVPYNFVRWTIDGLPQSDGVAAIQVYMSGNRTAVATYSKVTYSLSVQSTPAGIQMSGDKPGLTDYVATCEAQSTATLTAPQTATAGSAAWAFVSWSLDGLAVSGGSRTLGVVMDGPHSVQAFYAKAVHTLTVQSSPSGIAITGSPAGTTPFSAQLDSGTAVTLTAPWSAGASLFDCWQDAGGSILSRSGTLAFAIAADTTAVAAYSSGVTQFYVDAAGTDDNPGTTPQAPMRSIQTLLARYPGIGAGCRINVAAGRYVENIVLGSSRSGLAVVGAGRDVTTIDGGAAGRCFDLDGFAGGTIRGFTITNGLASGDYPRNCGGGIYCKASAPVITDNIIRANNAGHGAGIFCDAGAPAISGNVVTANTAIYYGGGVYCRGPSSPEVANNIIAGNNANYGGGIVLAWYASPAIRHNTIAGNKGTYQGGGVYATGSSSAAISSSILWGNISNNGREIYLVSSSAATVSYSDVWGGQAAANVQSGCTLTWGEGNITADPLFANAAAGDYHVKSRHGRWNPSAGGWVNDTASSPCIDAADPASPWSAEPQPNFGRANMGAWGNTPQASKSGWTIPGDTNGDCQVNIIDLINARNLLGQDPLVGDNWRADVNQDAVVNMLDLIFVRNRMSTACK